MNKALNIKSLDENKDMGLMPARVVIKLSQLRRNIEIIRNRIGKETKLLLAVKGNAYGHGAVRIAKASEETSVDYLGVDNIAEADDLRKAGIGLPILVMGPYYKKIPVKKLIDLNISITISDIIFARRLNRELEKQNARVRVHVNVDTGMGRMGIFPDESVLFFEELQTLHHIKTEGILFR